MTRETHIAKRFRTGAISVTLLKSGDRSGRQFYTATVTRSIRARDGRLTEAPGFRTCDIPVLRALAFQAVEWANAHPLTQGDGPTMRTETGDSGLAALCALIELQFTR